MGSVDERRRAPRHRVDVPGDLRLSDGRRISVRIVDLGPLGALLSVHDLEEAPVEGERAVLVHPALEDDGSLTDRVASTAGSVVRVHLEFSDEGVSRHLAIYFDGGPEPASS